MKYYFKFIVALFRFGVEIKRGVQFRHSTLSDSRIRRKVRSVLTLGSLCLPCCAQYLQREADLFDLYILYTYTQKYLYQVKIIFTPKIYTLCMYESNILHF